jgi:hypothetical protein
MVSFNSSVHIDCCSNEMPGVIIYDIYIHRCRLDLLVAFDDLQNDKESNTSTRDEISAS